MRTHPPPPSTRPRLFLAVCAALGLLYLATLNDLLPPGGDNARYIVLSRAVAAGQGFRLIDMPGAPPFVKTPPLWPLAIAPVSAILPSAFWLMKLIAVACLFAGLVAAYRLIARRTDARVAGLAVVLALLTPWMYTYAHDVRPEALYVLLSLAALVIATGGEVDTPPDDPPTTDHPPPTTDHRAEILRGFAAGGLVAAAYLARSAGIVLLPAVLVATWAAGRRRQAVATLVAAVALALPWHVYARQASAASGVRPSSYLTDMAILDVDDPAAARAGSVAEVVRRIAGDVPKSLAAVAEVVFYLPAKGWARVGGPAWVPALAGLGVLALYGYGVLGDLRRRRWSRPQSARLALPLYELGFWVLVLIWPYTGPKFIVPVIPLLWARLIAGGGAIAAGMANRGWVDAPRARAIAAGALAGAVLCAAPGLARAAALDVARRQDAAVERYIEAARWVGAHTPADAVVMARKPDLLYLHADRLVAEVLFSRDAAAWESERVRRGITFVVVDSMGFAGTDAYVRGFVEAHPETFEQVFETAAPVTRVYRWGDG